MLMAMRNSAFRERKEKKKRGKIVTTTLRPGKDNTHDPVISRDQSNGREEWCLGITLSQVTGVEGLMPKLPLSETGCREFPRLAGVHTREGKAPSLFKS